MELALATAIGVLTAIGIYLLLRARSFDVILGITFLSYATNLLIFAGGCRKAWTATWATTPTRCHRRWC